MTFKSGFNIFQFICHEENRGKYNYFSKTAFWKKTAVKFAWGYFLKKFNKQTGEKVGRGGSGANKKGGRGRRGGVQQKSLKLKSVWGVCLFGTAESSKTVKYIWICFYLVRH